MPWRRMTFWAALLVCCAVWWWGPSKPLTACPDVGELLYAPPGYRCETEAAPPTTRSLDTGGWLEVLAGYGIVLLVGCGTAARLRRTIRSHRKRVD